MGRLVPFVLCQSLKLLADVDILLLVINDMYLRKSTNVDASIHLQDKLTSYASLTLIINSLCYPHLLAHLICQFCHV